MKTGFCIYLSIRLNSTKPCPNCMGLVGHMIPASAIMLCSVQYPLLNYGLLNHFSPLQAMPFFDHGLHMYIYVLIFFSKICDLLHLHLGHYKALLCFWLYYCCGLPVSISHIFVSNI